MNFQNQVFWITGASSGIGKALVKELFRLNARIIISSRNEEKLNELAIQLNSDSNKIDVIPMDLTDPKKIIQAVQIVRKKYGKVDVLINNGGISQRSLLIETPVEVDRKVFEVNYFGTITVTKAILPFMIEAGGGHIVTISSIVGRFGFPLRSAYSASKHALHGFFETLRAELAQKNLKVTMVCPGRIVTDISVNAITKDGTRHGIMDDGQANGLSAERCAKKILMAVTRNKKEVYIGGKELMMVYFRRFFPWIYYKIVSKIKPT